MIASMMIKAIVSITLLLYSASGVADTLNCPCKVIKVTDGDTIHVLDQNSERHKIRLQGIDAPEKSQAFGRKSTQNLSSMVAGQDVEVQYDKLDRYGRVIGKVLLEGHDINLAQVLRGYAWHYKQYQREQSKTDQFLYSTAETQARSQRIGLWRESATPPWEYRRAKRK